MIDIFVTLGILAFIIVTSILFYKTVYHLAEKHKNDPPKRKKVLLIFTFSYAALCFLAALVLFLTSS